MSGALQPEPQADEDGYAAESIKDTEDVFGRETSSSASRAPSYENKGGDLLFITGNNPADFKRRENMTRVRKQAMDSYLQKEGKPKNRLRKQNEENKFRGSRTSVSRNSQELDNTVTSKRDALILIHSQKRQRATEKLLLAQSTALSGNKHRTPTPDSQTPRISPSLAVVRAAVLEPSSESPTTLPTRREKQLLLRCERCGIEKEECHFERITYFCGCNLHVQ
jgi:hypothetical protein